jgi:hypothetical protein
VEDLASGATYCQILNAVHPGSVQMSKVKMGAKTQVDFIHNFKQLQVGSFLEGGWGPKGGSRPLLASFPGSARDAGPRLVGSVVARGSAGAVAICGWIRQVRWSFVAGPVCGGATRLLRREFSLFGALSGTSGRLRKGD